MRVEIAASPEVAVEPIVYPILRRVLRRLAARAIGEGIPNLGDADVSLDVTLVGEEEIRELNARYRERDESTDVLAFPLLDTDGAPTASVEALVLLGDVVIAVPVADRQAEERGVSLLHELSFLACHGALHLLGWDHPDEKSLEDMHSLTLEVLDAVFLVEDLCEGCLGRGE